MKYISHRGNLYRKMEEVENDPKYIDKALKLGFDCEVDVWNVDGQWWLGHDKPQYKVPIKWIRERAYGCWYHAKSLDALDKLMRDERIREVFWHENDKFTLTKGGHIWTFPGNDFKKLSVINLRAGDLTVFQCHGICADDVWERKNG